MQGNRKHLQNRDEQSGNGHIWLIAAIAVLAIVLTWTAFNRSEQAMFSASAEESEESQQETAASTGTDAAESEDISIATENRIAAARTAARADLLLVQAELEVGATYDDVQQDIDQIKANLAAAYANTSDELQDEHQDLREELESLEDSIQNDAEGALDEFGDLSVMSRTDVRSSN